MRPLAGHPSEGRGSDPTALVGEGLPAPSGRCAEWYLPTVSVAFEVPVMMV